MDNIQRFTREPRQRQNRKETGPVTKIAAAVIALSVTGLVLSAAIVGIIALWKLVL